MVLFFVFILAYLIGSIPFGLLLTKAAGLGDIRNMGSGNIGATNVLRTGNKKLALLTLLLDGGKGYFAMALYLTLAMNSDVENSPAWGAILIPFCVVLGHVFPVWLKFKGGKGVATALGAFLGYDILIGSLALAIWLVTFAISRISSLSAIVTFALIPFVPFIMFLGEEKINLSSLFEATICPILPVSALVIYRHKENIRRLLNGTEPKFGKKP
jgi:glycerol-3-phosphate acyltransferase PlsY